MEHRYNFFKLTATTNNIWLCFIRVFISLEKGVKKKMTIRSKTNMIFKEMLHHRPLSSSVFISPIRFTLPGLDRLSIQRSVSFGGVRCAASDSGSDKKVSARLSQVHQLLQEAEERASSAGNDPIPKITLDHVTVSFARSGGPGGQNVNKVNTKVDMRFNVKNAYWLSDRVRQRIMQMSSCDIMNGTLKLLWLTSSKHSHTSCNLSRGAITPRIILAAYVHVGNVEDALGKLQAIIDAASYVPPPPSEEQKKKIAKLAAIGEQKRLKK
ncbi:hypothetical protein Pint_16017 [Pistacia integerrima]|uniref:Uncharacterized protein n=1 Tax=Pistacia integerrima TaxID=434235 RepID=A0ACC0ZED1_9ROSI|nr:hypothetical protein Pint_16017 [Pistacia integerrima]